MSALLQMRLKEHLQAALLPLKLLGQSGQGDVQTAPQIFIGDLPPKRQNTPGRPVQEVPCVVIIPLAGHIDVEDGAATSVATIALACCVYNPDREYADGPGSSRTQGVPGGAAPRLKTGDGDSTGMESDLANLVSAVQGALLPCAQGEPLAGRFVLMPDEKGKVLSWVRPDDSPVPFASATITSRWAYKGWE